MNIYLSDHAVQKLRKCSSVSPATLKNWLCRGNYVLLAEITTDEKKQGVLVWDDLRKIPLLVVMIEKSTGFVVATVFLPRRNKVWGGKQVVTTLNINRAKEACGVLLAKRY